MQGVQNRASGRGAGFKMNWEPLQVIMSPLRSSTSYQKHLLLSNIGFIGAVSWSSQNIK